MPGNTSYVICIACTDRAVQLHHVVPRTYIKRYAPENQAKLIKDPRNLTAVCLKHHELHTSRMEPLSIELIPDSALDFAVDLMGADATYNFFARFYGRDARVDSLLPEQRRAA